MGSFEQVILDHMRTIPPNHTQAVDRMKLELSLAGHEFWFFHWRLRRMVRNGLIRQGRPIRSVWRSYDGTPTYGPLQTLYVSEKE